MKHGKSPYTSAYYIWENTSAVFYSSCYTPFHSHNTLQLVLDTQKNFRFRLKNGPWGTYKCLVVKENVIHQLDTNKSVQLIIYLNAETKIAKAIKSVHLVENDIYSPDFNIFHLVNFDDLQRSLLMHEYLILENLINKILGNLSNEFGIVSLDERIEIVKQAISASHPEDVTIGMLASRVHLSESRLRSIFKLATGVSLYHFILCNKIWFATNQIMKGVSVQDAAYDAGFTDSSHYHKMMVKLFGISPSRFLKENMTRKLVLCHQPHLHFETKVYSSFH
jgi:AraC-like DNA-binding protein